MHEKRLLFFRGLLLDVADRTEWSAISSKKEKKRTQRRKGKSRESCDGFNLSPFRWNV